MMCYNIQRERDKEKQREREREREREKGMDFMKTDESYN